MYALATGALDCDQDLWRSQPAGVAGGWVLGYLGPAAFGERGLGEEGRAPSRAVSLPALQQFYFLFRMERPEGAGGRSQGATPPWVPVLSDTQYHGVLTHGKATGD